MTIIPVDLIIYGQHYAPGWIGFVHHHSLIATAIMWFTKWWRRHGNPSVSHVFVVSGSNSCVEANADGVDETELSAYFTDPKYTVYFRKPIGWSADLGDRIVSEARKYLGAPYDFKLIAADAFSYSLVGRIVNGLTGGELDEHLTKMAASPKKMICDKLAVLAMQAQPELRDVGTIRQPARENNPQKLFEDERLFADRTYAVVGAKA